MRLIRTLVTGAGGMLATDLTKILSEAGQTFTALPHDHLDITDPTAVTEAVAGHDVVINTAAWTDVDGAETDEAGANAVNGTGVANIARACAAHDTILLHISTDAVFNGAVGDWRLLTPYREDAPPRPVNAYGRGKLIGEHAVAALSPKRGYVVRTSWLYGATGRSFMRSLLDSDQPRIEVVSDQWGSPTWSRAVATRLVELAGAALDGTAPPGIYHATSTGATTWYALACTIFHLAGLDQTRLVPIPMERYHRAAPQGHYNVLGQDKWSAIGMAPMAHWADMLTEAFKEIR